MAKKYFSFLGKSVTRVIMMMPMHFEAEKREKLVPTLTHTNRIILFFHFAMDDHLIRVISQTVTQEQQEYERIVGRIECGAGN